MFQYVHCVCVSCDWAAADGRRRRGLLDGQKVGGMKAFKSFPFLSRKSPICGCVFNRQTTPKDAKMSLQLLKPQIQSEGLNKTTGRVRGSSLKPVGTPGGTQELKGLWPFDKHSSLV